MDAAKCNHTTLKLVDDEGDRTYACVECDAIYVPGKFHAQFEPPFVTPAYWIMRQREIIGDIKDTIAAKEQECVAFKRLIAVTERRITLAQVLQDARARKGCKECG